MRAATVLICALAACGRIGFGQRAIDAASDGTAPLPSTTVYLKASNTGANDLFGASVALSSDGTLLAIGAYQEASSATGVGGNQADNSLPGAGAVYLFTRGATWTQTAYVKASNPDINDQFGFVVALAGDGHTLAVTAPLEASSATGIDGTQTDNSAASSGAVYVFSDASGTWAQQAYVKASNTGANDQFGYSIALSYDGSTLAVGARQESSGATGIGANQLDNSAMAAGAVYVFERAGVTATWLQQAYIKPTVAHAGYEFGRSVALSDDGNTLGAAATYDQSNATGVDGDDTNVLASAAGGVYVFSRAGTTWTQSHYLKASNTDAGDSFGWNVSIAGDGNTIAVAALAEASATTGVGGSQADNSAPQSGAVYVFARAGTSWVQEAYVKASNTGASDHFGWTTALARNGGALVVGATAEASAATGIDGAQADNSAPVAGAAYLYRRNGGVWAFASYLKATNTEAGDDFGKSVAVTAGGTIAIGASSEDSAATGVGGDGASNAAMTSGAAYVFE